MTDVQSVSPVASQPTPTVSTGAPSVDYNTFLKLLIEQLKTQDPTQPMDSKEFMAQLATFSQVEQGMKTNTKLDLLLSASALTQAESAIGRTVTAADGSASGVVTSVRVTDQGPLATLANGSQVLLGSGVVLS